MNKPLLGILSGTVLIGAVVTIIEIWVQVLDWDNYLKLMGTLAIVFVVTGLLMVLKSDFGSVKKLKDDNYLD